MTTNPIDVQQETTQIANRVWDTVKARAEALPGNVTGHPVEEAMVKARVQSTVRPKIASLAERIEGAERTLELAQQERDDALQRMTAANEIAASAEEQLEALRNRVQVQAARIAELERDIARIERFLDQAKAALQEQIDRKARRAAWVSRLQAMGPVTEAQGKEMLERALDLLDAGATGLEVTWAARLALAMQEGGNALAV